MEMFIDFQNNMSTLVLNRGIPNFCSCSHSLTSRAKVVYFMGHLSITLRTLEGKSVSSAPLFINFHHSEALCLL